jgi:hypothetical protein
VRSVEKKCEGEVHESETVDLKNLLGLLKQENTCHSHGSHVKLAQAALPSCQKIEVSFESYTGTDATA